MFPDRAADLSDYEKSMPHYKRLMAPWRREDAVLAQEVQRAGNVVLGQWPEVELANPQNSPSDVKQFTVATSRSSSRIEWQTPPLLWRAARHHAHFRVEPDQQDGIVRMVRLFEQTPHPTPAFGLAVAAAYLGLAPQSLRSNANSVSQFRFGGRSIALHRDGRMLINFVGGNAAFDYETQNIVHHRVLEMPIFSCCVRPTCLWNWTMCRLWACFLMPGPTGGAAVPNWNFITHLETLPFFV
jgi:hypothetical protein